MNSTTEEKPPEMNDTGVLHRLGREFQNFTFRDIISSDLFLPEIDSTNGLDYEDSALAHFGHGTGESNEKNIPCNGSSICKHLFNSSGLNEVVESSTRKFTDTDLWEENDYFALLNVPAMVFIAILMIFGIVGNTLVVYVYGFRFKPTTQHFLIVCLACLDLLMACIAMPTEIADLRFHHTFSSLAACKLLRFISMFSSTSSSFTLVTIAWDRHKRVTKPLTKQMTLKDAKIWESLNLVAAVFFSWPLLVMSGLRTSETRVHGLFGTDCSFSDTFHGTRWPLYYNSILGLGFIVMVVVLGTLYFQIWKRAKRHRIYMAKRLEKGPISTTSAINEAEARDAAKKQLTYVNGENQVDLNCANKFDEVKDGTDLVFSTNNKLDISSDKTLTSGCHNVARKSFRNDFNTIHNIDTFNLPSQIDKEFFDNMRDPNFPFFSLDENNGSISHCLSVLDPDNSSSLEGVSAIPVFHTDMWDTKYRFKSSDSITSEKSQLQENKKAIAVTVSSSSSFRISEESNCLITRSKSLASMTNDSIKQKTSKPRRMSVPYLLASKPFRKATAQLKPDSILQVFQETLNRKRSTSQKKGETGEISTTPIGQSTVEDDLYNQENVLFEKNRESVKNPASERQNDRNSFAGKKAPEIGDVLNSGNQDNVDCEPISSLPSTQTNKKLTTKYGPDNFNSECRESSVQKWGGLANTYAQLDIDSENLNVLYHNRRCTLDSETSISIPSPIVSNTIDLRSSPCLSPTLSIGGESRERFLSANSISSTCITTPSNNNKTDNAKRSSRTIDKTTIVAFAVSIVFVVSFLPYLTLMFVRAFVKDFDYQLQSGTLWLYSFFLRFYLLNSAVNPLLYGWLNERFRAESKRLLCCCTKRKRLPD